MTFQESFSQDNKDGWVLAVDSSTHIGSLSFFNQNGLIKEVSWGREKRHSESLLIDFYSITKSLNLKLSNLEKIYLGIGPGSFTGVRVSCAFIKALSFSVNIPIFTFPSLRLIASEVGPLITNFNILTPSIGDLVFSLEYEKKQNKLIENICYKTKDLEQVLNNEYTNFFMHEDFKDKVAPALKKKINFTSHMPQSLYKSIGFSHKNELPFCNSTHIDLQPLYLRQSEAEEKYVLKEGG